MYLGIDTSCYTTSAAIVENGRIISDERIILDVKQGERGLRQSDAVFMHMKNMPRLIEKIKDKLKYTNAVAVSAAPRRAEGSYMPVFAAGTAFASVIADSLGVPLYKTTHQEGHIAAAMLTCEATDDDKFVCVHLSGGTSEILLCKKDSRGYAAEIVGKTLDLPAGQLTDRTGVACGIKFPCGKEMQTVAEPTDIKLPVTVKNTDFCFSGAETAAKRMVQNGIPKEEIFYAVFMCIAQTLEKALKNTVKSTGTEKIVLCGGVASNTYVREYLHGKFEHIYFAETKFSADNAAGTAYIGERLEI